MTDLSALIERVESGAGSDRELDGKIVRALSGSIDHWFPFAGGFMTEHTSPELTTSLDAVLSLIEAKLPGWRWLRKHPATMTVYQPSDYYKSWSRHFDGYSAQPARALLAAALRAIQESRNDR